MKNQITKNGKSYTLLMNRGWKESLIEYDNRVFRELKWTNERFYILSIDNTFNETAITYTLKKADYE